MAAPKDQSDLESAGAGARPSAAQTIIAVGILTLIAAGGGGFLGATLGLAPGAGKEDGVASEKIVNRNESHASEHGAASNPRGHPHATAKGPLALAVKELPPIVTNLASPENAWIRLQAAIVYESADLEHSERLVVELMSDITAYLRTVSLAALEGADGLRRLHEELSDRVAIRSERKVREFIIETMVVQ